MNRDSIRKKIKTTLARTSEALLALAAVLVFFLAVIATLELAFPEGTPLGDLVFPTGRGEDSFGASRIDLSMPEDSPFVAILSRTRRSVKDKRAGPSGYLE